MKSVLAAIAGLMLTIVALAQPHPSSLRNIPAADQLIFDDEFNGTPTRSHEVVSLLQLVR